MTSLRSRLLCVAAVTFAAAGWGVARAEPQPEPANPARQADRVAEELEHVDRQVAQLDARISELQSQHDRIRSRMIVRGRAYYRFARAGLLPLGAGFEELLGHCASAARLRRSLGDDIAAAQSAAAELAALGQRRQQLVDRQLPLQLQQQAMAQAHAALLEAEDRKRAFDKAFSSSSGPSYTAIYGAAPSGPTLFEEPTSQSVGGFATVRGRLPFPLAGRAEVRVVSRPGAGGLGLEMLAPARTPVRAVYDGRVAFADEVAPYGRVVILDHGDHYFTLSGNLGTIDVRVGDEAGMGSRIGTVGVRDGRGLLYFEIRHGGETLDPTPWVGL